MNVPKETGTWTPEQATEAMLDIAVQQVPGWAEKMWLLAAAARDAAPEGEKNAWIDAVRSAATADYAALCQRIVTEAGATPDQTHRFAHEVAAALEARFVELKASATVPGGRA